MPRERPFLTEAAAAGEGAAGAVPDALFDLAVNRAAAAVRGVGTLDALGAWHARTRFARRVPLAEVKRALGLKPAAGDWHWSGGVSGGWLAGKAPFP